MGLKFVSAGLLFKLCEQIITNICYSRQLAGCKCEFGGYQERRRKESRRKRTGRRGYEVGEGKERRTERRKVGKGERELLFPQFANY